MKRFFIFLVLCAGLPMTACAVESTPEPSRTPSPTGTPVAPRTIPPTYTLTPRPPSPTQVVVRSTAAPSPTLTAQPTATETPRLPTLVPATSLPAATSIPVEPPRPFTWDPRLDELNIVYVPAEVAPGELYWRLTHAEFWAEEENQGKHHIFVNVLDEHGTRLIGETITIEWLDGQHVITTEDKPAPEYLANYPMDINHYPPWHTLGAFSARVNGLPSDVVKGMGRPPPKSRPVAYLLTFERTMR